MTAIFVYLSLRDSIVNIRKQGWKFTSASFLSCRGFGLTFKIKATETAAFHLFNRKNYHYFGYYSFYLEKELREK